MNYTDVLWDFNGTILDDVDACIRCANRLLAAHGLPTLASPEAYRAVFGFPIVEYYRRLGFDFSKISYDALAVEWVRYYREEMQDVALCPEVISTLERFRAAGLRQQILSATHKNLLEEQTRKLGIHALFDDFLALDNIHAHSKVDVGRAWRAAYPAARPVMLGDTDHDAETARAIGADCILLTTGHQGRDTLERLPVRAVCDTLAEAASLVLGDQSP